MTLRILIITVLISIASAVHANPLDSLKARLHVKSKPAAGAPASSTGTSEGSTSTPDDQASTSSGHGTLGPVDVAGIRTGMTPNQVNNILMARDPKAQARKDPTSYDWSSTNGQKTESINIYFTDGPNPRAYSINRILHITGGFLYPILAKQLRSKYGQEGVKAQYMYWHFNEDGTLDTTECNPGKGSGSYGIPACVGGFLLRSDLTTEKNILPAEVPTTVVNSINLMLFDYALRDAGNAAAKARNDAAAAAAKQKTADQAAQNSASF